jgi:8-oxo-dGTP diphosphatase
MKLGTLVYLEHQEQVLMIRRQKADEHQGMYLAFGGKLEPNEAPHSGALREFHEETGLQVLNPRLSAVLSFPDLGDSPFGDEWQVFVFHATQFSGTLTKECPEGQLEWISREALSALPMWEGDRLFTPKVFDPGCFTASFLYRGSYLQEWQFWEPENP